MDSSSDRSIDQALDAVMDDATEDTTRPDALFDVLPDAFVDVLTDVSSEPLSCAADCSVNQGYCMNGSCIRCDGDGDGFFPTTALAICATYGLMAGDCRDDDLNSYPGAIAICGDGRVNDCTPPVMPQGFTAWDVSPTTGEVSVIRPLSTLTIDRTGNPPLIGGPSPLVRGTRARSMWAQSSIGGAVGVRYAEWTLGRTPVPEDPLMEHGNLLGELSGQTRPIVAAGIGDVNGTIVWVLRQITTNNLQAFYARISETGAWQSAGQSATTISYPSLPPRLILLDATGGSFGLAYASEVPNPGSIKILSSVSGAGSSYIAPSGQLMAFDVAGRYMIGRGSDGASSFVWLGAVEQPGGQGCFTSTFGSPTIGLLSDSAHALWFQPNGAMPAVVSTALPFSSCSSTRARTPSRNEWGNGYLAAGNVPRLGTIGERVIFASREAAPGGSFSIVLRAFQPADTLPATVMLDVSLPFALRAPDDFVSVRMGTSGTSDDATVYVLAETAAVSEASSVYGFGVRACRSR